MITEQMRRMWDTQQRKNRPTSKENVETNKAHTNISMICKIIAGPWFWLESDYKNQNRETQTLEANKVQTNIKTKIESGKEQRRIQEMYLSIKGRKKSFV